jgi:hypothetical protein
VIDVLLIHERGHAVEIDPVAELSAGSPNYKITQSVGTTIRNGIRVPLLGTRVREEKKSSRYNNET